MPKLAQGTCLVCGLQAALIEHDSSIITHSRIVERDGGELDTERCPGSRSVVLPDKVRDERVRLAMFAVWKARNASK